jgi:hypothetical protein
MQQSQKVYIRTLSLSGTGMQSNSTGLQVRMVRTMELEYQVKIRNEFQEDNRIEKGNGISRF